MKVSRYFRAALSCVLASWLLFAAHAVAEDESMHCNDKLPATHAQLAEGDQNRANHLELSRKLGAKARWLHFETDKIGGDRSINVVSGRVELLANPDAYENLDVNVVMGHFADRRQDTHRRGVLVSKSLSGTGKGSIDINEVRGSVDLKSWE